MRWVVLGGALALGASAAWGVVPPRLPFLNDEEKAALAGTPTRPRADAVLARLELCTLWAGEARRSLFERIGRIRAIAHARPAEAARMVDELVRVLEGEPPPAGPPDEERLERLRARTFDAADGMPRPWLFGHYDHDFPEPPPLREPGWPRIAPLEPRRVGLPGTLGEQLEASDRRIDGLQDMFRAIWLHPPLALPGGEPLELLVDELLPEHAVADEDLRWLFRWLWKRVRTRPGWHPTEDPGYIDLLYPRGEPRR